MAEIKEASADYVAVSLEEYVPDLSSYLAKFRVAVTVNTGEF